MAEGVIYPATNKVPRGLGPGLVALNDLPVGPLPSGLVTVTAEDVSRWAALHEDASSWYTGHSPWGDPIAPPTILYYPSQSMLGREIGGKPGATATRGGGGFARYRAEFLAPIPIGRPIQVSGAITDKFIRRGIGYLVWEMSAVCDGVEIQRQLKSWTFFPTPDELYPERPSDPRAAAALAIRDLGSLELVIDPDRTRDFEGAGESNGHTDFSLAQGLPGLLVQGELSFGLIARLMLEQFGASFVVGGTMDIRFIRPVYTTDTITARSELISAEGGATCRVWAENANGEMVTVGVATAGS